jgi:ABC-type antimicrobial peptide transport system permease subunit
MSLRRDFKSALFSMFGVALGIFSLVFFVGLGLGVGKVVRERIFPVDARLLEVVPPSVSLGSLFGAAKLDEATVQRIEKLPSAEAVFRKMNVRVPGVARYEGSFFGSPLRMSIEVLAVGAEPGLFQADVRVPFSTPPEGAAIPIVISSRLLEIYNKTFAPARKLPQLSAEMLVGFSFATDFNRSWVSPNHSGPVVPARLFIAGVSERAMLAGVTVPLEVARRINRTAGVDADTYSGLSVLAKDASDIPQLSTDIRAMGLSLDEQDRRLSQNAGAAVLLVTSALALLSALICILAAVNIAHALSESVKARAQEIGLFRALGATRGDVRSWVLAEAAVLGFLGGGFGTLGAWALSLGCDALSRSRLPDFPFKPDSFFLFPVELWAAGWGLGVLASLVGAYFPSRRAAAVDPIKSLAG